MAWISKPSGNLTIDEMNNNAAIVRDGLEDFGWSKQAIICVLAWMDYISTINPEGLGYDENVNETYGLLPWPVGTMAGWATMMHLDPSSGDTQLQYLHHTETEPMWWSANPYAEPTTPPFPMSDFILINDSTQDVLTTIFGWYYCGFKMTYLERQEVQYRADYWQEVIDELTPSPDKNKKKSKWIYMIRRRW